MIVADTVASDAHRARNGLSIVSGAQGQISQLVERRDAFLTLALQQTTKTTIFGWSHNEGMHQRPGVAVPHPM